jgi:hypothetical protein
MSIRTILSNGNEEWRLNSELHRGDGPARIRADGSQEWYINGELHREDGPAFIRADGSQEGTLMENVIEKTVRQLFGPTDLNHGGLTANYIE